MKLNDKQILIDAVRDSEMVLIGVGEEWGVSFEQMMQETAFAENVSKLTDDDMKNRLVPVLQREYLKQIHEEKLQKAYDNLVRLIKDKNYFVVSMNKDRYPVLAGLKEEKCVFPCGGYDLFQCDAGCTDELTDASAWSDEIYERINCGKDPAEIFMPKCQKCGNDTVYNNIEAMKYVEAGYLPAWEYYRKWLQGTVNKKLCLIEMGVSLRFPSVIRWAFEKTAYYNQKAKMFRIHHSLSQPAENISGRCYSCDENSVAYMANLFVS